MRWLKEQHCVAKLRCSARPVTLVLPEQLAASTLTMVQSPGCSTNVAQCAAARGPNSAALLYTWSAGKVAPRLGACSHHPAIHDELMSRVLQVLGAVLVDQIQHRVSESLECAHQAPVARHHSSAADAVAAADAAPHRQTRPPPRRWMAVAQLPAVKNRQLSRLIVSILKQCVYWPILRPNF